MFVKEGIAYAGEAEKSITVISVSAIEDYKLWLRFSTGEIKTFDFMPLLNDKVYLPLMDKTIFNDVYIDYGVTVWKNGEIDIAPEYLYQNAVS